MDENLIDMHIHTTASDGTWSLNELLKNITDRNINFFSITDHNILENSLAMKKLVPKELKFYMGVEVSCTYKDREYHITCYDFDYNNKKLNQLLENNIKNKNLLISIDDYLEYKYNKSRGGWNSLNYLYDKKIINNILDYFQIVKNSNQKITFKHPKEVIQILNDAGGKTFLAHPSAYEKKIKVGKNILEEWISFGIDGIECYSPYLEKISDSKYYIDFCNENNLMISAGSDCHGEFNNRKLGEPKVTIDQVKMNFI